MVQVTEVLNRSQLKKFIKFPNILYKGVSQYVPTFYSDEFNDWNPDLNPAMKFCDARCWLAMRDGKIVGRIGAIINKRSNEKWGTNRMRFTAVDFIDDREVSAALFETVENWAREKGCNEIHGPLGFTDLDREGLLVEGFDRTSLFFTYYNYPYYKEHLAAMGYVKDVDWVEHLITVPNDTDTTKRFKRISDRLLKDGKLHLVVTKRRREYTRVVSEFFRLVNESYSQLYSTTELDEEQISKYAAKFAPLINPRITAFVMNEKNEMIGMGVGAPNLSNALRRSNGKYFPFGWLRMLISLYRNDTIDLLLIGVHPDYQGLGVNAIIINKILEGCRHMGITHAETGPMLETNTKALSQWKTMEKEQHKRRRCYIKQL